MAGEAAGCVACGGTVAPDGHCWDCGKDQPAFGSHLEVTVDGAARRAGRAVQAPAGPVGVDAGGRDNVTALLIPVRRAALRS
ncbi:hypothetical protein [Actinomadura sp. SCN-SB]|uniref:hypothetical protein n=1 Tax=Actinomadura sp. SCN-SB TaxID=3373092 RepID=UPI003752AB63